MAGMCARVFTKYCDKYCPGGEMWVTESGGAGAGGHTWAPTYFAVLLWNKLMGNTVYDFGEEIREGIKINRKSVMQIILSV